MDGMFGSTLDAIVVIGGAMGVLSLVETLAPLHARGRWGRAHLPPNLKLTALTFATNAFMNVGILALIFWLESQQLGLLRWLHLPPIVATAVTVAILDLTYYAVHVSWHRIPGLWRFHAVHHSDPAVDVTTTIRQHPVEGLLRYAAIAAAVLAIGPTAPAFALYRIASALNGLLEHTNVRAPRWLDAMLSWVTTWPHMHKIHHSRAQEQTDSNYGNLFSLWDRIFGTYTPSHLGTQIDYGLEGFDEPMLQTTGELLAHPFRQRARPAVDTGAGAPRAEL